MNIIQLKVNLEDTEENRIAIHKIKEQAKKIKPSTINGCILVQHIVVTDYIKPQFISVDKSDVKKAIALIGFNKKIKKKLKKKGKKK